MTTDSRDATCGTKVWTREPPTKPGYYWVRYHGMDEQIVQVLGSTVYAMGTIVDDDVCNPAAEWHGPILPPED